jgi:hypothetical protein
MPGLIKNQKDFAINELERQLERSGFFTHSSLSNQAERINEIESFLYGLIDSLFKKGLLEKDELEETVKKVRDETLKKKEHFHAGIAISFDNEEKTIDYITVNCEERLHICKAVCCQLQFALTIDEIETGKIKWDLGQPYFIRQTKNGCCVHKYSTNHKCSIYENRPGICRKYSCANDKRIWNDFENMNLNNEWIDTNLKEQKIQLQQIYMIPEETIEYKSKSL